MQKADYPLPDPLITVSPDWLGGEPCFHALDEFLEAYPSVSRAHAIAVIDLATHPTVPA